MNKVKTIKKWIACPQFGDDHYGELGALPFHKRKVLKDLCDYVEPLELHDKKITKTAIELQKIIDKTIKYVEKEIYKIEPIHTYINYNCEYDSEEDYVAGMIEQSRLNTLKEILELLTKGKRENE
jgi:hypothetical protein